MAQGQSKGAKGDFGTFWLVGTLWWAGMFWVAHTKYPVMSTSSNFCSHFQTSLVRP